MTRLIDTVRIVDRPDRIEAAYATEVNWPQGYRLNADARLLLLGASRLINRLRSAGIRLTGPAEKLRTALVLGQNFGSLSSYEAFDDSLLAGAAEPLACTLALPSVPVSAIGIRFGFCGPALTLAGGVEVGLMAVRDTLLLLALNRCDHAIVGCWYSPSATTLQAGLPDSAQLILLALQAGADRKAMVAAARAIPAWRGGAGARTCVDVLDRWLSANGAAFTASPDFVLGEEYV